MQFECGECGMNARLVLRRKAKVKSHVEAEMVCEAGCDPSRWMQRLLPARKGVS